MELLFNKIDQYRWFGFILLLIIIGTTGGILTDFWILGLLPWLVIIPAIAILYPQFFFYLLFFLLPFSVEVEFDNGLATDFPTEPLIILIAFLSFGLLMAKKKFPSSQFILHPLTIILLFHLLWIGITTIFTSIPLVSIKFLIAKLWYILTFFIFGGVLMQNIDNYRKLIYLFSLGLIIVISIVTYNHAVISFSFEDVNKALKPFFRNHVSYGVMLVIFLPHLWALWKSQKLGSLKRLILYIAISLTVVGVFLSYCRAAILTLCFIPLIYLVFRLRAVKPLLIAISLTAIMGVSYLVWDNNYLAFQPDFDQTQSHKNLEDHLVATYEGTDMSVMERLYRWVAAGNMISEHPFLGFGPGTYISHYRQHSSRLFETYVSYSDNDISTSHNYFLLLASEQGILASLIFMVLIAGFLIVGESLLHRINDNQSRIWVIAIITSQCLICINILMADLIEVDKTGALFFLNLAMLINLDLQNKKESMQ